MSTRLCLDNIIMEAGDEETRPFLLITACTVSDQDVEQPGSEKIWLFHSPNQVQEFLNQYGAEILPGDTSEVIRAQHELAEAEYDSTVPMLYLTGAHAAALAPIIFEGVDAMEGDEDDIIDVRVELAQHTDEDDEEEDDSLLN